MSVAVEAVEGGVEDRGVELLISRLLRLGVSISVALVVAGTVVTFIHHPQYLSDRDTDMILVGGANVYPGEIESALDEHPAVTSSCVIGLPDDEYGNVVHAIVQASEPLTPAALEEFLRSKLTKYKRPRTYEFVATPLRGDDGKVRRTALRAARIATRR